MTSLFTRWENWSPQVLSIVRIVAALCFLEHGLEKFSAFPSRSREHDRAPLRPRVFGSRRRPSPACWGLHTAGGLRVAGNMAVAYFLAHFPRSFYPAVTAAMPPSSTASSSSTSCSRAADRGASTAPCFIRIRAKRLKEWGRARRNASVGGAAERAADGVEGPLKLGAHLGDPDHDQTTEMSAVLWSPASPPPSPSPPVALGPRSGLENAKEGKNPA